MPPPSCDGQMDENDPRFWLIAEALQVLGWDADPKEVAPRVERLQRGLPAEDEFSAVIAWLGRCKLVHKLDQLQRPAESKAQWQVPDLLSVFEYDHANVTALVEVKTTGQDHSTLEFSVASYAKLKAYSRMVGLPLLVAWRKGTFWTLFDFNVMKPSPRRYKISFLDAMKNTLMGLLAGDFSYSFRPGAAFQLDLLVLGQSETDVTARVEAAYWVTPEGDHVTNAPGVYPLFVCVPQDVETTMRGDRMTHTFTVDPEVRSQLASRALSQLAISGADHEQPNWRRLLEALPAPAAAAEGLHDAAATALAQGFIETVIEIHPEVTPSFLQISDDSK